MQGTRSSVSEPLETRRNHGTDFPQKHFKGINPTDNSSLGFSPQNCDTMRFCCLSYPVGDTSFSQP